MTRRWLIALYFLAAPSAASAQLAQLCPADARTAGRAAIHNEGKRTVAEIFTLVPGGAAPPMTGPGGAPTSRAASRKPCACGQNPWLPRSCGPRPPTCAPTPSAPPSKAGGSPFPATRSACATRAATTGISATSATRSGRTETLQSTILNSTLLPGGRSLIWFATSPAKRISSQMPTVPMLSIS
jgi:hypothetical protein